MELVRGFRPAAQRPLGCVLTVGNYDGVHLGHRQMLGVLKARAGELGTAATVLVFEPSSKEFIDPDGAPPRLTRWREKFLALQALGIDRLVTLRFDEYMRAMSPDAFVEELLVGMLGARHVVVGHDFRYGCNASGDVHSLRRAGARHGFVVEQVEPFVLDGVRVSSTAVRGRLQRGDFAGAERLLGRPYRLSGRVIHGNALGRTLGFPTANLRLLRRKSPVAGVLAVRVWGIGSGALPGVASLGTRPTIGGGEVLLEVHIFDYDGDLYGQRIEVELVAKLRDEAKFETLQEMQVQMHADALLAREILIQGEP